MSEEHEVEPSARSLAAQVSAAVARWLGASVYQLTIRAAVTVCTFALFVYFAVNSPSTVAWMGQALESALPGRIALRALRWGPSPGRLTVHDLRLADPTGHPVAELRKLEVELSWLPTLARLLQGDREVRVRADNLVLDGLSIRMELDPQGQLRLVQALVAPPEPPENKGEPRPFSLVLDRVGVRDARYFMDLGGVRIDIAGLGFVGDFHLETDRAADAAQWGWTARGVQADNASLWLAGFETAGLAQLPGGRVQIGSAVGGPDDARLGDVRVFGEHTVLERGDIAVKWAPELDVKVRRGVLRTRTPEEPFLGKMLGDLFAAEARFEGDVDVDAQGRSHVRGEVRGSGRMSGFDTRSVRATIDVHSPTLDGDIVDVVAKDVDIEAFGGRVRSDDVRYHFGADGLQTSRGRVTVERVSIAESLGSPAIGMSAEQTAPLAGTVDGAVDVDVALRTGGPSGLWMQARTDLDVRVERDARTAMLGGVLPTLHFRGGVDTMMEPDAEPPRPLWMRLREARVSDRLEGETGATTVQLRGEVDLHDQTVAVEGDAALPDLAALLRPFGVKGVAGGLKIDELSVAGPYLRPTVRARLRGDRLVASGTHVDDLRTRLALDGDVLSLRGLGARLAQGQVGGDLDITLFSGDVTRVASPIRVAGRGVSVRDVELGPLLSGQGIRGVSGRARLEGLSFRVDLDHPARSLRAAGHLTVVGLAARFDRFDRLEADFRFGGGRLELPAFSLQIPPHLRRGEPPVGLTALVKGSASVGLERGDWSADLSLPTLHFVQFGDVRALQMPLLGSIEGTIHAEGARREVAIRSDVVLRGLAWDKIVLGDARLHIDKARDGPAVLSSDLFFPKFALREGSVVAFRGLVPEVVALQVVASRFDPWALLGLPPMNGLQPWVAGNAEVRFDFRPGQTVFAIEAQLPPGGAEVELQNGLDPIRNRLPATVRVLPDRVELDDTELVFGTEAVELCGTFFYPDDAKGLPSRVAYYLAGHVEVPRFGALADSLANLEFGFDIGPSADVERDPGARCLHGEASKRGAMRLSGPLDAIEPTGRAVLARSRVVPRGYGREIMLAEGAVLDFRRDKKGQLIFEIPRDKPLEGRIDDGRFKVWGTAQLDGYSPEDLDLHFDGVDLAYTVPKEYALVVTPTLRFRGRRLRDDKRRDMLLSGTVLVNEGQYSKSFDKLGKVIGGVRGRELDGYSEPLLERMPWVGDIRFDLGVRGQNFEVLSRFPFGSTDLELGLDTRVRGTMATPELYGRVEVQPGSTLTYSVVRRDFEVTEGSIDFNGAVDKAWLSLTARTEVPLPEDAGSSGSSSIGIGPNLTTASSNQTRKVVVTVRISGPLDDPRRLTLSLSSTPSYGAADIQSLILTGQLQTANSASGGLGSRASIGMFTEELSDAFQKMLLSAFVDSLTIGIPTEGGINAEITTNLGKAMTLKGRVYSTQTVLESSATFSLRLGERWSLEGLVRSSQQNGQTATNIYEAKLRYRVPLPE